MKRNDRIEALRWSEKYRKDFDKYRAALKKRGLYDASVGDFIFPLSPAAKRLCRKYKIPCPISPESPEILPPLSPGERPPATVVKLPAAIPVSRWDKDGKCRVGPEDDGFMTVKLDFDSSLPDIQKAVDDIYHRHKPSSKSTPRNRNSSGLPDGISIWDIYAMRHRENKNLADITRELFNISGSLAEGSEKARYRTIERAYKKAKGFRERIESHR